MIKNSKRFVGYLLFAFWSMFLVVLSSYDSIKAESVSDYDGVSFSSYKANVVGMTDQGYVNSYNVVVEFNLPASVDSTKLMVQYNISNSENYVWTPEYDYNENFNEVGLLSFEETLPGDINYIHSRIKLYGSDTIYSNFTTMNVE